MGIGETDPKLTFYETDRVKIIGTSLNLIKLRIVRTKKDEAGVFETTVGMEEFSPVDQKLFHRLTPGMTIIRGNGHFATTYRPLVLH